MKPFMNEGAIRAIAEGTHGSPYDVLGMHEVKGQHSGVVVHTFQPFAQTVELIDVSSRQETTLGRIHENGLFEYFFPGRQRFPYRLRMTGHDGHPWELDDPYRFPLQVTDFDVYLFGEGTHYRTYEKMGAHPMTIDGVEGVHFAVWAPNAIARERDRLVQSLGRSASPDAASRSFRTVGNLHSGADARRPVQVRDQGPPSRVSWAESGSIRIRRRDASRSRPRSYGTFTSTNGTTICGWRSGTARTGSKRR